MEHAKSSQPACVADGCDKRHPKEVKANDHFKKWIVLGTWYQISLFAGSEERTRCGKCQSHESMHRAMGAKGFPKVK